MGDLAKQIKQIQLASNDKQQIIREVIDVSEAVGYSVVDIDDRRPWGGFVRFATRDAADFVEQFFPGTSLESLQLGREDVELSPKFLIVMPGERLSWQRHERRAERWVFLSPGGYHKSSSPDEMGEIILAESGDIVQFEAGECHRLVGAGNGVTLVAEIWQHTDPDYPSDEDDIERLQDDYQR